MKTTALICIVFAMAIMGCESSKKAVADKMAAESKFNDMPDRMDVVCDAGNCQSWRPGFTGSAPGELFRCQQFN